jgi:hypothetical protein
MAKRKTKATVLADDVLAYFKERETAIAHFKEADVILDRIVATKPAGPIVLDDGRVATLLDAFIEKNKVFRAHGISRYELKLSRAVDAKPAASGPQTTEAAGTIDLKT